MRHKTRRLEQTYKDLGLVAPTACRLLTSSCRQWRLVPDCATKRDIEYHPQELLSTKGRFYLVAVKDNDIPSIRAKMLNRYGLQSEVSISTVYSEE